MKKVKRTRVSYHITYEDVVKIISERYSNLMIDKDSSIRHYEGDDYGPGYFTIDIPGVEETEYDE
jgi:hypothetical protein